jgi:hypothetical protein
MELEDGGRRRNNRIIVITGGLIVLLALFSWRTAPPARMVKIALGDDSYQVASLLSREAIPFTLLAEGEGVVVEYRPLSPLARLDTRKAGSRYEIRFAGGKVTALVWRDRQGTELARLLFIRLEVG